MTAWVASKVEGAASAGSVICRRRACAGGQGDRRVVAERQGAQIEHDPVRGRQLGPELVLNRVLLHEQCEVLPSGLEALLSHLLLRCHRPEKRHTHAGKLVRRDVGAANHRDPLSGLSEMIIRRDSAKQPWMEEAFSDFRAPNVQRKDNAQREKERDRQRYQAEGYRKRREW